MGSRRAVPLLVPNKSLRTKERSLTKIALSIMYKIPTTATAQMNPCRKVPGFSVEISPATYEELAMRQSILAATHKSCILPPVVTVKNHQ